MPIPHPLCGPQADLQAADIRKPKPAVLSANIQAAKSTPLAEALVGLIK